MCADLWSFALSIYARPGCEAACLRLQEHGADVCLLLCGAWLEQRGVALEPARIQALQQLARPWQKTVVEPLRQKRMQRRTMAQQDVPLAALRERVKALELEAERELLGRLEQLAQKWQATDEAVAWLETLLEDRDARELLRAAATQT